MGGPQGLLDALSGLGSFQVPNFTRLARTLTPSTEGFACVPEYRSMIVVQPTDAALRMWPGLDAKEWCVCRPFLNGKFCLPVTLSQNGLLAGGSLPTIGRVMNQASLASALSSASTISQSQNSLPPWVPWRTYPLCSWSWGVA